VSDSLPILVVQHQGDAPLGLFTEWLTTEGVALDVRRPDLDEPVPDGLDHHAGLIVLGGSMGAHDDAAHPWLTPTKTLLREAVGTGVPMLGICLGHQLAAVAFGGTSRRNPKGQTVGVLPIGWRRDVSGDPLCAGVAADTEAVVAHWNGDVISELPSRGAVLATTPDGAPQVLRLAERAWGVQFHPEIDQALLSVWADEDRQDAARRGVDVDAALQQAKEQEDALRTTGRRLAQSFATIVRDGR
jgi:GMP synthase (glutamine-hydrolysing)